MATVQPSDTTATLIYASPPPDGERAYLHVYVDRQSGQRVRNYPASKHSGITIHDIRGSESSVSLDIHGFQYLKHTSTHTAFTDEDAIREEYYPETIALLKNLTGASDVVLFDHTIRRNHPSHTDADGQSRGPFPEVHADQTPRSALARVHRHLPPDLAPTFAKKRFQILNLWRPISHAAFDWPLALCDYRSVNVDTDEIPVTLIFPDREGENYGIKYNANHEWYYLRGMTPEEAVVIKCFDSKSGVAKYTPHTAFEDPTTPKDALPRESIEVRALVFYD